MYMRKEGDLKDRTRLGKTWKFLSVDLYYPIDGGIVAHTVLHFLFQKTGEIGELSCGWSSLPLFEHSGNPTPNKTFELKVHGGTPFESGVEVDPASRIKGIPCVLKRL